MLVCLYCRQEVTSKEAQIPKVLGVNRCPHCNNLGLYRGRTSLGEVRWGIGIWAGLFESGLGPSDFTPAELRLIADDLERLERVDGLRFDDGSGSGKAGRNFEEESE